MIASQANSRRWQRHPVELPVRILPCSRLPATPAVGRSTRLSQGGMALFAGVEMEPEDLIEVEFLIPNPVRVMAAVRNRRGHSFGLEFLTSPAQPGALPKIRTAAILASSANGAGKRHVADSLAMRKLLAALDRKLQERARLKREIDALLAAGPLLAE
jgi:hypothetical protein